MPNSAPTSTGTSNHAGRDIDRILIDRERIARRVEEMAVQIRSDLEDLSDEFEIILVPILTGSIIFLADLIRQLPQKIRISVVTVSSYPGQRTTTTGAPIVSDLPGDLENRHVLIVDDILDSGTTIRRIRGEIEHRAPRTLRACVLLRKNVPSALETPCEYIGFEIPDEFVVGYGLDYNGYYRNLPDIGVLKKEALHREQ
ncbi:MAG: hypoxanthine phosphoribosyltransferase [Planctomycetota bacterium]|nr:hypoxanthine phosphoribosyltransferase [Planctomycetota bacterium]